LFNKGGASIVAAEMVEPRLYARLVANIDSSGWSPSGAFNANIPIPIPDGKKREAVVLMNRFLYGLIIIPKRPVLGPIQPEEATDIFIRSA
jgi:hypothetical protein